MFTCECTPQLLSRAGINFSDIAREPLPDRIVERWMEAILTNALKRQSIGKNLKQIDVDIKTGKAFLCYKKKALQNMVFVA
jgi:hypothetical protein